MKQAVTMTVDDQQLVASLCSVHQGGGRGTWQAAADRIKALSKELAQVSADHKEMVARNKVLRDRPDLPIDRLPAIKYFTDRISALEAALRPFSGMVYNDNGDVTYNLLVETDDLWRAYCVLKHNKGKP